MRTLILSTSLLALGTVAAQAQVYGSAGFTFSDTHLSNVAQNPIVGSPTNEPFDNTLHRYTGTIGYLWNDMVYGQLEFSSAETDLDDQTVEDAYLSSYRYAVRGGYVGGTFVIGAFYGAFETIQDNDANNRTSEREFWGIEGSYRLPQNVTAFVQIGQIGGPGGTDGGGDDSIHDADFYLLGASYDLSDFVTLTGSFADANGRMDGDDMEASTFSVRMDFDVPSVQNLFLHAEITQTRLFQDESGGEEMRDNTISLGATYRFGGQGPMTTMADLGYLENWSALSGGVME
ncbi:porin [Hasllibacter sp. MH4015]|uniref:porin n=1 Tax=Hasllibacter sp. MH4015 TaxID=2854029 RepID=UPI001CD6F599|nr:porin [Hasllibacter sp. MH4015]